MAYDRGMGPLVKGWSPPFSPSGLSPIWRVKGPGYTGVRMSHEGILLRYEADAEALAALLPAPLKPTERTGEVGLFVNVSRHISPGFPEDSVESRVSMRFHEALFIFSCELDGQEYMFHWIMYTDSDWAAYTSVLCGLHWKYASFRFTPQRPPHPVAEVEAEGPVSEMLVTRDDRPLIEVHFTGRQEVAPTEVFGDAAEIIGMRYIPDVTNRVDDRPLVHDIVIYDMVDQWTAGKAWSGDATLTLGDHRTEELHLFAPKRMLSAHHIEAFGYTNLGPKVLYDYMGDR